MPYVRTGNGILPLLSMQSSLQSTSSRRSRLRGVVKCEIALVGGVGLVGPFGGMQRVPCMRQLEGKRKASKARNAGHSPPNIDATHPLRKPRRRSLQLPLLNTNHDDERPCMRWTTYLCFHPFGELWVPVGLAQSSVK